MIIRLLAREMKELRMVLQLETRNITRAMGIPFQTEDSAVPMDTIPIRILKKKYLLEMVQNY